jgi:hypothetical protein
MALEGPSGMTLEYLHHGVHLLQKKVSCLGLKLCLLNVTVVVEKGLLIFLEG